MLPLMTDLVKGTEIIFSRKEQKRAFGLWNEIAFFGAELKLLDSCVEQSVSSPAGKLGLLKQ